jgi:leucyl aminopeptidase
VDIKLIYQPLSRAEADAVAVVVFEDEAAPPDLARTWFEELRASGEFTGKTGELAVLHQPQGLTAKRLVAAGGGKHTAFDSNALRRTVAASVRTLKQKGVKHLDWVLGS